MTFKWILGVKGQHNMSSSIHSTGKNMFKVKNQNTGIESHFFLVSEVRFNLVFFYNSLEAGVNLLLNFLISNFEPRLDLLNVQEL